MNSPSTRLVLLGLLALLGCSAANARTATVWRSTLVHKIDATTTTKTPGGVPVTLLRYRGNPGDQVAVSVRTLQTDANGRRQESFPERLTLQYRGEGAEDAPWKLATNHERVKAVELTLTKATQDFVIAPRGKNSDEMFQVEVRVETTAPQPFMLRWDHTSEDRLEARKLNFYDLPVPEGTVCEFEVGTYGHTPTFSLKQGDRNIPFTTVFSKSNHGLIRVAFPRAGTYRLFVGGLNEGSFTHYKLSTWSALRLEQD